MNLSLQIWGSATWRWTAPTAKECTAGAVARGDTAAHLGPRLVSMPQLKPKTLYVTLSLLMIGLVILVYGALMLHERSRSDA